MGVQQYFYNLPKIVDVTLFFIIGLRAARSIHAPVEVAIRGYWDAGLQAVSQFGPKDAWVGEHEKHAFALRFSNPIEKGLLSNVRSCCGQLRKRKEDNARRVPLRWVPR